MSILTGDKLITPIVSTINLTLPVLPSIYPPISITTLSVGTITSYNSIEYAGAISSINFGQNAGISSQTFGAYRVNVGPGAGERYQSDFCIGIGYRAGFSSQFTSAVAVGAFAGVNNQRSNTTAVGFQAGSTTQAIYGTAIGALAGANGTGIFHIFIGNQAGLTGSANQAICIGNLAGQTNAGFRTVTIGHQAGNSGQGSYCVSLGYQAGLTNQYISSIVINATPTSLTSLSSGLYVNPIRNDETKLVNPMHYLSTTCEVTYNPIVVLSSANASSFSTNYVSSNLILAGTAVGINKIPGIGNQLELSGDNAVQATQTLWKTSSDARIKLGIISASLEICYSTIQSLQLKRYELTVPSNDKHVIGLIAQDVQTILPKSVRSTTMNGINDFLCLDYDQIYKMQIGATQHLINRIESLEAHIKMLKIRSLALNKPKFTVITPFG